MPWATAAMSRNSHMGDFKLVLGIDYAGAQTPTARLRHPVP